MNQVKLGKDSVCGDQGLIGRWSSLLRLRPPRRRGRAELDRRRYSDTVSIGRSPTIRDIEMLARKAGFRALLNLNTEGEPGQILSPNVESTWAHAFELQHERVSIEVGNLRSEGMDRFLETLQKIGKPVYVHSLCGRRAASLMTVHMALERRLSANEAFAEAKALGMDCEIEELRAFTESEVDQRTHARSPGDVPSQVGTLPSRVGGGRASGGHLSLGSPGSSSAGRGTRGLTSS